MASSDKIQEKARAYAFLLLKFRQRSEKELRSRLNRKKFDREVIDSTIRFLKEKNFIDDRCFARSWIKARIKRPLGIRRLEVELKLKGVSPDIIEEELDTISKDYSEEEVVTGIILTKSESLKRIDPEKAKRRIYSYLLRRGFSPGVIIEALKR